MEGTPVTDGTYGMACLIGVGGFQDTAADEES